MPKRRRHWIRASLVAAFAAPTCALWFAYVYYPETGWPALIGFVAGGVAGFMGSLGDRPGERSEEG